MSKFHYGFTLSSEQCKKPLTDFLLTYAGLMTNCFVSISIDRQKISYVGDAVLILLVNNFKLLDSESNVTTEITSVEYRF